MEEVDGVGGIGGTFKTIRDITFGAMLSNFDKNGQTLLFCIKWEGKQKIKINQRNCVCV